jgi:hypothetical protein
MVRPLVASPAAMRPSGRGCRHGAQRSALAPGPLREEQNYQKLMERKIRGAKATISTGGRASRGSPAGRSMSVISGCALCARAPRHPRARRRRRGRLPRCRSQKAQGAERRRHRARQQQQQHGQQPGLQRAAGRRAAGQEPQQRQLQQRRRQRQRRRVPARRPRRPGQAWGWEGAGGRGQEAHL